MCKPEFPTSFQELYAIFHVLHFSKLDSDNDSVPHLLLFFSLFTPLEWNHFMLIRVPPLQNSLQNLE